MYVLSLTEHAFYEHVFYEYTFYRVVELWNGCSIVRVRTDAQIYRPDFFPHFELVSFFYRLICISPLSLSTSEPQV